MSRRGALLFAAMAVIWGIPYLLIKVAVVELGPEVLVFARFVVAVVVLAPVAWRAGALQVAVRHWPWVLVYAAVEMAAPWWLLADAELRVSSSLAGLVIAGVPLVGAALAYGLDRERLEPLRAVGLVVGVVGVAALLGLDLGSGVDVRSVLELLGVVVLYAVGPLVVVKRLGAVPALGVNALALAACAVGYAPFALPRMPAAPPPADVLAAVAVLGLVCTALAFVLFFALIAEVGPVRATVITYVNPAVAVVLGVLVLDEPLTTGILVGFPLVLLGSVLATWRGRAAVPEGGSAEVECADAAPGAGAADPSEVSRGPSRPAPGTASAGGPPAPRAAR